MEAVSGALLGLQPKPRVFEAPQGLVPPSRETLHVPVPARQAVTVLHSGQVHRLCSQPAGFESRLATDLRCDLRSISPHLSDLR